MIATMNETREAYARSDCGMNGHDYQHVTAVTDLVRVFCQRCSKSWAVITIIEGCSVLNTELIYRSACGQCEANPAFNTSEERAVWVGMHQESTGHRVLTNQETV